MTALTTQPHILYSGTTTIFSLFRHTNTHIHSHTYTLTHSHTLTHIHTHSHTLTHTYTLTHSHTHKHSHSHTLTHIIFDSLTQSIYFSLFHFLVSLLALSIALQGQSRSNGQLEVTMEDSMGKSLTDTGEINRLNSLMDSMHSIVIVMYVGTCT